MASVVTLPRHDKGGLRCLATTESGVIARAEPEAISFRRRIASLRSQRQSRIAAAYAAMFFLFFLDSLPINEKHAATPVCVVIHRRNQIPLL